MREITKTLNRLSELVIEIRDAYLRQGDEIARNGFDWNPWDFTECPECGSANFDYDEKTETWNCNNCGACWNEEGMINP